MSGPESKTPLSDAPVHKRPTGAAPVTQLADTGAYGTQLAKRVFETSHYPTRGRAPFLTVLGATSGSVYTTATVRVCSRVLLSLSFPVEFPIGSTPDLTFEVRRYNRHTRESVSITRNQLLVARRRAPIASVEAFTYTVSLIDRRAPPGTYTYACVLYNNDLGSATDPVAVAVSVHTMSFLAIPHPFALFARQRTPPANVVPPSVVFSVLRHSARTIRKTVELAAAGTKQPSVAPNNKNGAAQEDKQEDEVEHDKCALPQKSGRSGSSGEHDALELVAPRRPVLAPYPVSVVATIAFSITLPSAATGPATLHYQFVRSRRPFGKQYPIGNLQPALQYPAQSATVTVHDTIQVSTRDLLGVNEPTTYGIVLVNASDDARYVFNVSWYSLIIGDVGGVGPQPNLFATESQTSALLDQVAAYVPRAFGRRRDDDGRSMLSYSASSADSAAAAAPSPPCPSSSSSSSSSTAPSPSPSPAAAVTVDVAPLRVEPIVTTSVLAQSASTALVSTSFTIETPARVLNLLWDLQRDGVTIVNGPQVLVRVDTGAVPPAMSPVRTVLGVSVYDDTVAPGAHRYSFFLASFDSHGGEVARNYLQTVVVLEVAPISRPP